jgi:hypothetical protein
MRPTRAQVATTLVVLSLVVVPVAGVVEGNLSSADTPGAEQSASPDDDLKSGIRERVPQPSADLRAHTEDHSAGGAKVGVVGSAFDSGHPAIAADVAADRQLGTVGPFDSADHDTAVAEVVRRTAPESELYLAGVGSAPTPERYARAIEWLVEQDVDVIVDSGSYFPTVAGDGERVAAAAAEATDEGVVFVTSAGNYAGRHWAGQGTTDGWVTFGDDEANELAGGERLSGRVSLRLRWQSSADYDLYLYRRLPGRDAVVAEATTRERTAGRSIEAIDVAVPPGQYYVAVDAHEGIARPAGVQLFAAHHSLEHTTERGSMVAPATSRSVITVGALAENGTASYSSRNERGGTDVAAPGSFDTAVSGPLNGTSAAAPYVAGTAAVVASGDGDLSPDEIERILESSSDGGGVDTEAAVAAAENHTDGGAVGPDESQPTDDADGETDDGDDGQRPTDDDERSRDDGEQQRRDDGRPRDDGGDSNGAERDSAGDDSDGGGVSGHDASTSDRGSGY